MVEPVPDTGSPASAWVPRLTAAGPQPRPERVTGAFRLTRPWPRAPSSSTWTARSSAVPRGQALNKALMDEGVLPQGRTLPGDRLLYAVNDRLGENLFSMGLVRAAARVAKGWRQNQVQAAGKRAVADLSEMVAPFAPQYLEAFRADGHLLVLATTTPVDMITPFAEAMGFDAVIATTYETKDGRYTGRLYEGFVWGTGKLKAVRAWCTEKGIDLDDCHACSDSVFDTPLLASVGLPHAVNPDPSLTVIATARRWPIEHWDRPPGVPSVVGVRALSPAATVRPPVVVPLCRASTSPASITSRRRGLSCWPPTIGVTSTWRHSPSSPPGSAVRCASWARRRSSTPRWWAPSPGRSGASRWTGAAGRISPCGRPKRLCGRARSSSCCRKAPSLAGPRSSTPSSRGRPGRPDWPQRRGPWWSRSGCGGPRRSGRARPGCPTSPWCATLRRSRSGSVTPSRSLSRTDAVADTAAIMAAISDLLPEESKVARRAHGRGAGAHQTPFVRFRLAILTTRAVNADVASPRSGTGHRGRRSHRAQGRSAPAPAPDGGP